MHRTRRRKKSRRRKKGGSHMRIGYPTFAVSTNTVSTQEATRQQPSFTLPSDIRYATLVLYDPDSSVPAWLHYLVVNIPNGDVSSGEIIMPYAGPAPPTGTHRYIFELLQQVSPIRPNVDSNRGGFNINDFREKNNLSTRESQMFKVRAA